jgi:hypothetical protein
MNNYIKNTNKNKKQVKINKDKSNEYCFFNTEILNISEIPNYKNYNPNELKEQSIEGDSKILTEMDSELDNELSSLDKIIKLNKLIRKRKFKNEKNY